MKTAANAQLKAASDAFAQWASTGTLPASYVRSVLGEQLKSVSPNISPTAPVATERKSAALIGPTQPSARRKPDAP